MLLFGAYCKVAIYITDVHFVAASHRHSFVATLAMEGYDFYNILYPKSKDVIIQDGLDKAGKQTVGSLLSSEDSRLSAKST